MLLVSHNVRGVASTKKTLALLPRPWFNSRGFHPVFKQNALLPPEMPPGTLEMEPRGL